MNNLEISTNFEWKSKLFQRRNPVFLDRLTISQWREIFWNFWFWKLKKFFLKKVYSHCARTVYLVWGHTKLEEPRYRRLRKDAAVIPLSFNWTSLRGDRFVLWSRLASLKGIWKANCLRGWNIVTNPRNADADFYCSFNFELQSVLSPDSSYSSYLDALEW